MKPAPNGFGLRSPGCAADECKSTTNRTHVIGGRTFVALKCADLLCGVKVRRFRVGCDLVALVGSLSDICSPDVAGRGTASGFVAKAQKATTQWWDLRVTEEDGMTRRDDPQKMAEMARWLDAVSEEVGLDREFITTYQGSLLRLIGIVAHGPSRPAAPLTAFLVGYAAASRGKDPHELVASLENLAENWEVSEG